MDQCRDHANSGTIVYGWGDGWRNSRKGILNRTISLLWSLALYHVMVLVVYLETWGKLVKIAYENDT